MTPGNNNSLRRRRLSSVLLCLYMLVSTPAFAAQQTADNVVRDVFTQVLFELEEKKQNNALNPDSAKIVFAKLLNPRIDYVSLARWILRDHWIEATEEQRVAFLEAFQNYIINTYALALSNGRNVALDVEPDPVVRKNTAIVRAAFSVGGETAVPLEFRLIERDEQWKLFDVSFAGVSLALTFRSDFTYVAKDGGINAITTHLVQRAGTPP